MSVRVKVVELVENIDFVDDPLVVAVGDLVAVHTFSVPTSFVQHKRTLPNDRSSMPYDRGMFDLNRLRVFRAVVASGSVNETARRLGYAPSSVSQQVHALEKEVGFPLIERVGRGIRPTPAGADLARASTDVLDAMTRLEARARDLREGSTAKLTIATFASASYAWMPGVARALRQEFPGLTLELSIFENEVAETAGKADVEVHTEVPFEDPVVPSSHSHVVLGTDTFLVALPMEHPLANVGAADLSSFASDDWVQCDFRDEIATRLVGHACTEAGFTPHVVARAQDHVAGLAFVAAGVGIALIPHLAVRWSAFPVAYVHPLNPTPTRRIAALIRKTVRTSPAAARSLSLLAGYGRGLGDSRGPRP